MSVPADVLRDRRRTVVEVRCIAAGCGNLLLAVIDTTPLLVVVDMHDLRSKIHGRRLAPAPDDPRVPGFREPVFYAGLDGTRWPMALRCRDHAGAVTIGRPDVTSALDAYRRSGRRQTIRIHPAPDVSM